MRYNMAGKLPAFTRMDVLELDVWEAPRDELDEMPWHLHWGTRKPSQGASMVRQLAALAKQNHRFADAALFDGNGALSTLLREKGHQRTSEAASIFTYWYERGVDVWGAAFGPIDGGY